MVSPLGNWGNFAKGALGVIGEQQKQEDDLDSYRKQTLMKVSAEKQINSAKADDEIRAASAKKRANIDNDPVARDIVQHLSDSQNGMVNLGGGSPTPQQAPMPGVPQGMQQPQQAPMPGQAPQAAEAPIQPNTGPAMQQQPAMAPQQPEPHPELDATTGPQGAPNQVPATSPAGQLAIEAKVSNASAMMQQGANPMDVYLANFGDTPQTKSYVKGLATMYDIQDPVEMDAVMQAKAQSIKDGQTDTEFRKEILNPWMTQREKQNTKGDMTFDQLPTQAQEHINAAANLGLARKDQPLRPLSKQEDVKSNNLVEDAQKTRAAAAAGMSSVLSMANVTQDMVTGPLAEADAKLHTYLSALTGEELDKKYAAWYESQKNSIQITNAQMRSIGATRPGIQLALLEKEGSPSANLPPEAKVKVMTEFFNNYRELYNHSDAIQSGPSGYTSRTDRLAFANAYAEANPAQLPNGDINPDFKTFKEWQKDVAEGNTSAKGPSRTDIMQTGAKQLTTAKKDVEAGGTGKVSDPNVEKLKATLPEGATIERLD